MGETIEGHGGELALAALRRYGVAEVFTLNGAHVWPLYDAFVKAELPIYDTRHEETATFAAEGMAKLTRRLGLAALTAGPGVTNGLSPVASAQSTGSPLVVIGGRAAQANWGEGSLQEFDHVPLLAAITKSAATAPTTAGIASVVDAAAATALTPHRGPTFVDIPLDLFFGSAAAEMGPPRDIGGAAPDPAEVEKAARLLAGAERPCLVVGADVYWNCAEGALRDLVEDLRIPTFMNGQGRGCLPADHPLAFSRTRQALKQADVVCVIGTPLDFRLSFGRFGRAQVIHISDSVEQSATHVALAAAPVGDIKVILEGIAGFSGARTDHDSWIARMQDEERAARQSDEEVLSADASPIHPGRIYGELRRRLDRDAVVVNDGGDFVSYSGKYIDSFTPGCWLDPGPFGCLGTGLGYAMAARIAHPDRQVVVMLGDGAAGFSLMDVDSLVRHNLPVVMIMGNNGIWALEKHPMQMIYGYDVACDLRPSTPYHDVVRALGGAGEEVTDSSQIGPALDRAFASGVPYLVNVITDPGVVYPRSSNLV